MLLTRDWDGSNEKRRIVLNIYSEDLEPLG